MTYSRFIALSLAALGAISAAGCSDDSTDSTLHVRNDSDFSIVEIRVTSVGSPTWGPNLIDGDELRPGESILVGVECDTYDALLVDEEGVDCELHDLDLCLNDADWIIRNNTCTVFGAARAAREAAKQAGSTGAPATPGTATR